MTRTKKIDVNNIKLIREQLKKIIKKLMENSIIGGRGVSEGHFHFHFFLVPNGLKISFRH